MKKIPIFFTFNNNYISPAGVAFFSLLNKKKNDITYDMYVLHSDITSKNIEILNNIVNRFKGCELHFISTDNFLSSEWKNCGFTSNGGQFTHDTLFRCFADKFFPQFEKIIYSDVDIVFSDDISELWDLDLKDTYIAAVKNPWMKYLDSELSHLSKENYEKFKDTYFAGGIWVLNLKQMRQDDLDSKMLDIINNPKILKKWNDQDVMNLACNNNVTYLPLNYIAYPYAKDFILSKNFSSDYTIDEIWDSIINPKIIHYAAFKPWDRKTRYDDAWWDIFTYLKLPNIQNARKLDKITKLKNFIKAHKKIIFIISIIIFVALIGTIIALLFLLFS